MLLRQNCNICNYLGFPTQGALPLGFLSLFRAKESKSAYPGIFKQLSTSFINVEKFDDHLHSRTSSLNLIGIGLSSGLPKPFLSNEFHIKCKVVPKSVANSDSLEPLYCKGLFTTLAITKNPIKRLLQSLIVHKVTSALTFPYEKITAWLLDRNSKSGLIGVGLASGLRAIS